MKLARRRLFLAMAGLTLTACGVGESGGPAPIVGRIAPDFTASQLDEQPLTLSSYEGKPVVLNFFATWCVPCKRELPAFQAASQRYAERGLAFLLVDVQEDPDDVAVFLDDLKITLPAVIDKSGEIVKTYRVRGLPSTFFLGRDRAIKFAQLGTLDDRLLEKGISNIV